MKLFKYLIFIFLSLPAVNLYASYYVEGRIIYGTFSTPQQACDRIKTEYSSLYTFTANIATMRCEVTISGDLVTQIRILSQNTCTADGSSVQGGNVSITAKWGSDEYAALRDVAISKFQGTHVCSSGCRFDFDGSLSGKDSTNPNANTGDLVTDTYGGYYKKTSQSCTGSGNPPTDSLSAHSDDDDPNDPDNPDGSGNGSGNGRCNGTNNCNTTTNNTTNNTTNTTNNNYEFDVSAITSAISQQTSALQSAISSAASSINSALSSGFSSLQSAINSVSGKIDQTNNKLDAANLKLDGVKAGIDQTNTKLDTTNQNLNDIKNKHDQTNVKLDTANQSLNDVKGKQDQTNAKLDDVNESLEGIESEVKKTNGLLEDIKDWLNDDEGTNFNESGAVDVQQHDVTGYEKNYVQWSGVCPPDKYININLMGQSSTLTLSWSPWCQLLAEIRWAIIACAYFAAAYIILGMR